MFRGRTRESEEESVRMYESKKVKRYRSAFTTSQVNYLEKQFAKCPYIGSATRKEVANVLNIPERAIKIWFQNRRMKEKKELNSKEQNIALTHYMQFAKDSLNNVHSSLSTNDPQRSLQPNVAKHVDNTNHVKYYNNAALSNQARNYILKKNTIDSYKINKNKDDVMLNHIKQDKGKKFVSNTANTLEYYLRKNNNDKNFVNFQPNKTGVPKDKLLSKTWIKAEGLTVSDSIKNLPSTLPRRQDLPEDLSARNLSNLMIPQNHQGNIHLSAYIPFFNSQNVCLPAGNVLWKPVNVMSAVPRNNSQVTVPERQLSTNKSDVQKCKCSCECRSRNRKNYNRGQMEAQPQYVIAIPYNNSLNILR